MDTGFVAFNILTIFIGIGSIIANIYIARYNVGKNRTIYDVEEIMVERKATVKLKDKLNTGEFTILTSYPNPSDGYKKSSIYVLGKIKK